MIMESLASAMPFTNGRSSTSSYPVSSLHYSDSHDADSRSALNAIAGLSGHTAGIALENSADTSSARWRFQRTDISFNDLKIIYQWYAACSIETKHVSSHQAHSPHA